jgi:CSLREA domain-containing protein
MRYRVDLAAVWIAMLLALGAPAVASAATFDVDSGADETDTAPGDGVCAGASGPCSLRAAVQEANALPGPDTITLQAGKHTVASTALHVTDSASIIGPSAELCTIRGKKGTRILQIAAGVQALVSGLTLEGGVADRGGAILNEGALQMVDAVVRRSQARADAGLGGAIFNDGNLELINVSLERNRALGPVGGLGGSLFNNGTAVLEGVRISLSRASGCGGAVFNNLGSIELTDATIDRNSVKSSGGGLFHQLGTMTLNNVTVSRNRAKAVGGGIFTYATLSLTNVSIIHNRGYTGGGLFSRFTPVADLLNVTLSFNRAREGGGIMNNGTVSLKNTILSGNKPRDCEGTAVVSNGNNLAGDATCTLGQPGDLPLADPLLSAFIDAGSGAVMYALQAGSPAIDAADNAASPAVDQRGQTRPADGDGNGTAISDIGAYELQP